MGVTDCNRPPQASEFVANVFLTMEYIAEILASQGAYHSLANRVGRWTLSGCFSRFDATILYSLVKVS